MNGLEKLSLLKMDFLGLTTLTIIADALKLIERHRGVKLTVEEIPLDDPQTYTQIFSKALTSGVFQFESPGMRDILRRYKPDRVEDLIALNALYRPGPMDMIDDFVDRKHGRKEVVYDVPELKEILEETYGVMVYQEQVMQISNRIAGYSLGDADLLRRAMGKKKVEEMAKHRELLRRRRARRTAIPRKRPKRFSTRWRSSPATASTSRTRPPTRTWPTSPAYLKAHYPIEFMSALLTSETGNTAKVVKYINECREMRIRVLPPDVNSSDLDFTPVVSGPDEGIRFGLGAIKNVGANAVESIANARAADGPFTSLYDFCERVDLGAVNRRMIESFIKAGAMDTLEGTRAQQMAVIDSAMENGTRVWKDRASGQSGLFAMLTAEQPAAEHPLPKVPDWTGPEKLTSEKEMLGFYITGHPLDQYKDKVAELATHTTSNLEGLAKGAEVALCGILTAIVRKRTREGKPWAAMQIEDLEGSIEALLFSTQYERLNPSLNEDKAVLIRGLVLPEENAPPKISVQEIVPLDVARVNLPSLISIKVPVNGASSQPTAPPRSRPCSAPSPATPRSACASKNPATSRLSWM